MREDQPAADLDQQQGDERSVRCAACQAALASPDDVLSVGQTSEGRYTNPFGYQHSVITFARVRGVTLTSEPTTEATWFPGWAWQICCCASCGAHVGWRYSAVAGDSPPEFWGLSRAGIIEP